MSTCMYAYVELKTCHAWVLAHPLRQDTDYNDEWVPQNIAPISWGKFNFSVYYEKSGEKDFPDDMGGDLTQFVQNHWPDANRPSWMSLREVKAFLAEDSERRYAHFNLGHFCQFNDLNDEEIRVVFWADQ